MTTVDTGDQPQDEPGVHATVAGLGGQMLLAVGMPLVGKDQFAERVLHRAAGQQRDTLHIAATRGYDRLTGCLPEDTHVVDCSPAPDPGSSRVHSVASPADLTGVGMPVSRFLQSSGPRPVVTLDSVSTLVAYSDDAAVFRFLAVLTAQLRQMDGVGVFLMEDGCHPAQMVNTFQQLFDGRVDVEPERVRVRGLDGVTHGWVPR